MWGEVRRQGGVVGRQGSLGVGESWRHKGKWVRALGAGAGSRSCLFFMAVEEQTLLRGS